MYDIARVEELDFTLHSSAILTKMSATLTLG